MSIVPPSTTRVGEIQLIFSFFNLDNEKLTPIEKVVPSYGGQIIVTRSVKVHNNKNIEDNSNNRGSIKAYVMQAIITKKIMILDISLK